MPDRQSSARLDTDHWAILANFARFGVETNNTSIGYAITTVFEWLSMGKNITPDHPLTALLSGMSCEKLSWTDDEAEILAEQIQNILA